MVKPPNPGVPQGTVLGPTLLLIYINDNADSINSTIRFFADDCVVYRQIDSPEDHLLLQEALQKLVSWSNTWQMEFNIDECAIMNFGTLRNKPKFDYKMKNQSLQVVKHHPYLGVELSNNMKYNLQIDSVTSKASRVLGFVKRTSDIAIKSLKKEPIGLWCVQRPNIVPQCGNLRLARLIG